MRDRTRLDLYVIPGALDSGLCLYVPDVSSKTRLKADVNSRRIRTVIRLIGLLRDDDQFRGRSSSERGLSNFEEAPSRGKVWARENASPALSPLGRGDRFGPCFPPASRFGSRPARPAMIDSRGRDELPAGLPQPAATAAGGSPTPSADEESRGSLLLPRAQEGLAPLRGSTIASVAGCSRGGMLQSARGRGLSGQPLRRALRNTRRVFP